MSRSGRHRPAFQAEASLARPHDRLIAVFNADLVEHTGDVVADSFLRHAERGGDLVIVETLSDGIQYVTLALGELTKRQGVLRRATATGCRRKLSICATICGHAGSSASGI